MVGPGTNPGKDGSVRRHPGVGATDASGAVGGEVEQLHPRPNLNLPEQA
jgi:hypothetical protein